MDLDRGSLKSENRGQMNSPNDLDPQGNLFTWNDLVKIKTAAPLQYRPDQIAVVCGMTKVNSQYLATLYNSNLGEWVYTVEYSGGTDIEIPERYLEKYSDESLKSPIDIRKYIAYFHDGTLADIACLPNEIVLCLSSAEVEPCEVEETLVLSGDHRICGLLHLSGVTNISVSSHLPLEDEPIQIKFSAKYRSSQG